MVNPFFKNTGPHDINYLLKTIDLKKDNYPEDKINDIKDLNSSKNGDITFFHLKKYSDIAKITKASYCITTESLKSILPKSCKVIISDNSVDQYEANLMRRICGLIYFPDKECAEIKMKLLNL